MGLRKDRCPSHPSMHTMINQKSQVKLENESPIIIPAHMNDPSFNSSLKMNRKKGTRSAKMIKSSRILIPLHGIAIRRTVGSTR